MRNRAKSREAKQAGGGLLSAAQQLLLPMIEGMACAVGATARVRRKLRGST